MTNTVMLIQTTSGFRETRTHNLHSSDPKAVVAHAKKAGLTAGFSIVFAVNHQTGQVVEIFKNGYICQRDVKPVIEAGFSEWLFSWAFAGSNFKFPSGEVVQKTTLDLASPASIERWRGAFGQ